MAAKRAKFYSYGDDDRCHDIRRYIEDAGIILEIRDLEKDPLSVEELDALLGYCDVTHYLNKLSKSYDSNGLDKRLPERNKVLELIAKDQTLLRVPFIKSTRLWTVGCDKKKIAEMLQIRENGSDGREDNRQSRRLRREEAYSASK